MTETDGKDAFDTEEGLIQTARNAISHCNWVVGECAAKWTRKYANGRTDGDFAVLVGLSADQVYQRRRVWETFSDVREDYPSLKWSHFYVALNWDDAPECLSWAEENQAAITEMKAWRRLQHGEDLTVDTDAGDDPDFCYVPTDPALVHEPGAANSRAPEVSEDRASVMDPADVRGATVSGAARHAESDENRYAPFRKGAGGPAPNEDSGNVAVAERPKPSTQQVIKRMTNSLERYNRFLTPEFSQQFQQLPEKVRVRFLSAVRELNAKVSNWL